LNRYAKYWQGQFDLLAATLAQIDERRPAGEAAQTPSPSPTPGQTPNQTYSPKRGRSKPRK
jgi:hypothetical protein